MSLSELQSKQAPTGLGQHDGGAGGSEEDHFGVQLDYNFSKFAVGASLYYGKTFRFGVISGISLGWEYLKSKYIQKKEFDEEAAKQKLQIWGVSYAAEIGISILLAPSKYIIGATVPRFMFDYMLPSFSDAISIVDRFPVMHFIPFAMNNFQGPGSGDFDFLLWSMPGTLLHLAKLLYRRKRLGAGATRTKRCIGVMLAQIFVRSILCSFAVTLPQSGGELVLGFILLGLDNSINNYLNWHTWPLYIPKVDQAQEAERIKKEKEAAIESAKRILAENNAAEQQ